MLDQGVLNNFLMVDSAQLHTTVNHSVHHSAQWRKGAEWSFAQQNFVIESEVRNALGKPQFDQYIHFILELEM